MNATATLNGATAQSQYPSNEPKEKGNFWNVLLKVIVAIATALAGAFGLQSCI